MNTKIHWVSTNGGPYLLLEASDLKFWSGANLDLPSDDYERACSIEDPVGVVTAGEGSGLVLSGWFPTTFLPIDRNGGILVRIDCAPDLQSVEELLHNVICTSPPIKRTLQISFGSSDIVLFDAAFPGIDIINNTPLAMSGSLKIGLETGKYEVFTSSYSPNPEVILILHHMIRC